MTAAIAAWLVDAEICGLGYGALGRSISALGGEGFEEGAAIVAGSGCVVPSWVSWDIEASGPGGADLAGWLPSRLRV